MEETEIHKQVEELAEAHRYDRFNRMVAMTVALLALVMVLGKLKENNVATGVMAVQVNRAQFQTQFQDRNLMRSMYERQIENRQLRENPSGVATTKEQQQQLASAQANWQAQVARLTAEQKKMTDGTKREQATHKVLIAQQHLLQFAAALMTLAITLFAVSALTRSKLLYGLGLTVSIVGVFLEIGGFLGWKLEVGLLHFLT